MFNIVPRNNQPATIITKPHVVPSDLLLFNRLADIPVYWICTGSDLQGRPGKRKLTRPMWIQLDACLRGAFRQLDEMGLPQPCRILSGGAYVPRPAKYKVYKTWDASRTREVYIPDRHAEGQAFDLVAMYWPEDIDMRIVCRDFDDDPQLYLWLESHLRLYFPTVLDHFFNAAHRGHFHFDTGRRDAQDQRSAIAPRNRNWSAQTFYVQAVCKYIAGAVLKIDGKCGKVTRAAVHALVQGWIGRYPRLDAPAASELAKASAEIAANPKWWFSSSAMVWDWFLRQVTVRALTVREQRGG